MKILTVAATAAEIQKLELRYKVTALDAVTEYAISRQPFGWHFDRVITGIGMMQTAYFLGRQLEKKKYDLVINVGIAGSFNTDLEVGSVVNVQSEIIADLGAEDGNNFLSFKDMDFVDADAYPYQNGYMHNTHLDKMVYPALTKLPLVKGVTVNKVSGRTESITLLKTRFSPDIESMEGAAFFYACLQANVPFIQIRGISNFVTVRDKSQWDIPLAIKNVNEVLEDFLKELSESPQTN